MHRVPLTRYWIYGYPELGTSLNMSLRHKFMASQTKFFFIFLPFFCIFDNFSKHHFALGVLHFEKLSNTPKFLGKIEEKPCQTCTHYSAANQTLRPKTQVLGTQFITN